MTAPQKLATPAEVAEYLAITEAQLAKLRQRGRGPKAIRQGHRTVRYAWTDVVAYLVSCRAGSSGRA